MQFRLGSEYYGLYGNEEPSYLLPFEQLDLNDVDPFLASSFDRFKKLLSAYKESPLTLQNALLVNISLFLEDLLSFLEKTENWDLYIKCLNTIKNHNIVSVFSDLLPGLNHNLKLQKATRAYLDALQYKIMNPQEEKQEKKKVDIEALPSSQVFAVTVGTEGIEGHIEDRPNFLPQTFNVLPRLKFFRTDAPHELAPQIKVLALKWESLSADLQKDIGNMDQIDTFLGNALIFFNDLGNEVPSGFIEDMEKILAYLQNIPGLKPNSAPNVQTKIKFIQDRLQYLKTPGDYLPDLHIPALQHATAHKAGIAVQDSTNPPKSNETSEKKQSSSTPPAPSLSGSVISPKPPSLKPQSRFKKWAAPALAAALGAVGLTSYSQVFQSQPEKQSESASLNASSQVAPSSSNLLSTTETKEVKNVKHFYGLDTSHPGYQKLSKAWAFSKYHELLQKYAGEFVFSEDGTSQSPQDASRLTAYKQFLGFLKEKFQTPKDQILLKYIVEREREFDRLQAYFQQNNGAQREIMNYTLRESLAFYNAFHLKQVTNPEEKFLYTVAPSIEFKNMKETAPLAYSFLQKVLEGGRFEKNNDGTIIDSFFEQAENTLKDNLKNSSLSEFDHRQLKYLLSVLKKQIVEGQPNFLAKMLLNPEIYNVEVNLDDLDDTNTNLKVNDKTQSPNTHPSKENPTNAPATPEKQGALEAPNSPQQKQKFAIQSAEGDDEKGIIELGDEDIIEISEDSKEETVLADGSILLGDDDIEIIEDKPETPSALAVSSKQPPQAHQILAFLDQRYGDKPQPQVAQTQYSTWNTSNLTLSGKNAQKTQDTLAFLDKRYADNKPSKPTHQELSSAEIDVDLSDLS